MFWSWEETFDVLKAPAVWPMDVHSFSVEVERRLYNCPDTFATPPLVEIVGLPRCGVLDDLVSNSERHAAVPLNIAV